MNERNQESLVHDPVHGYIPFTSTKKDQEATEREIINHPWVQRLRNIHQLQTAWWVFPTAEHTRFPHVVGAMHLASRFVERLYPSLYETLSRTGDPLPSRGYVESLVRMAGLLHDIGHGPFGHFFDEHFLKQYGQNHETLGAQIILRELAPLLSRVRQNPNSALDPTETIDAEQIAWLIQRPRADESIGSRPRWLVFLRSLLSGIYTIDNVDFVLRDAYMSGYSPRAFDLDRLLYYSFYTDAGLTIHERGMESLIRFIATRAELFRAIYFHRSVRAIDLSLADLFAESKIYLFDKNPLDDLTAYLQFTESSLLVDVGRWSNSHDPKKRALGQRWQQLLIRQWQWKMVCQRHLVFREGDSEISSIFTDSEAVEKRLRLLLPAELQTEPLRVDIAHHLYRPQINEAKSRQNFLYTPAQDQVRELTDSQLFRHLPLSHRICRVYAESFECRSAVAHALDQLVGPHGLDDVTNM